VPDPDWRDKSAKCRRLANDVSDARTRVLLLEVAEEYEAKAAKKGGGIGRLTGILPEKDNAPGQ
jgi:hypothetical protein